MSTELNKAIEEMGKAFAEFKEVNEKRISQIEEKGQADYDLVEKQQRLEARLDELSDTKERLEKMEADSKLPSRHNSDALPPEEIAHLEAFEMFLRSPGDPERRREVQLAARAAAELRQNAALYDEAGRRKDITITTTGGGNLIPTLVSNRIQAKVQDLSPIRQIANVQMATNENLRFVVRDNNQTSGWAAAGGARSETTTPSFQAVTLTYGTVYAYMDVQEEAVNDIAVDVTGMVEEIAAEEIAEAEGTAFVTGNGTARPTGFLNGAAVSPQTIVSTADEASPERAFGSVQYLPTGAAAAFQNDYFGGAESPEQHPQKVFIDTIYALRAQYRMNARWVANKATLGIVRRLRDVDGRDLWQPSLIPGQPATLYGYPITEAEAMPDVAANAHPMAFGDFNRCYQIADIVPSLRMTVDDNITAPGFVKFYIRRRVGGNLTNDDALKVIRCAAS